MKPIKIIETRKAKATNKLKTSLRRTASGKKRLSSSAFEKKL